MPDLEAAPAAKPAIDARDAAIELGQRHGREAGEVVLAKFAEHADPLPPPLGDALRLEIIAAAVNDIAAAEARYIAWGVAPDCAGLFRSAAAATLAVQIKLSVLTAVAGGPPN